LENAFAGKPRGYKVPNYNIYKYDHSEGLAIAFEVETRVIRRYIPPNSEFDLIEVERTDFVLLTGCTHRQVAEMRVSYMNMEGVRRNL
jgi:metal-dependent hydrolase (beta-lactamase superfamily II)